MHPLWTLRGRSSAPVLADEDILGGAGQWGLGRASDAALTAKITPSYNSVRPCDARRSHVGGARPCKGLASCGLDHTRDDHGARQVPHSAGTLMKLSGPWKQGWKAMTQRKAETADEFAVRCQEQIDVELVRAEPPMPPIHALPDTHAACACLQARQGAAASMADSHTGHTTPEGRRPPRLPGVVGKLSPGSAAALAPPPPSKRSRSSGGA